MADKGDSLVHAEKNAGRLAETGPILHKKSEIIIILYNRPLITR